MTGTKRTCSKGHVYFKSSVLIAIGGSTCPVCEQLKKQKDGWMAGLSAPARRALTNKHITSVKQLSRISEKEILQLHGMGPSSIPLLRAALKEEQLAFKK